MKLLFEECKISGAFFVAKLIFPREKVWHNAIIFEI
jgi:hypothetical protein